MASSYVDPSCMEESENERRREGFVPNEDLGEPSSRLVRAPADADALDGDDKGDVCFACNFVKQNS